MKTKLAAKDVKAGSFWTVRETSQIIKHSEVGIRRMLTEKKLTRYKCGGRTLISAAEATALIREA